MALVTLRNVVRYHPRMWSAACVGFLLFFVLPSHWSVIGRMLVCWNCGVALFLALLFGWMAKLSARQICQRYVEEDNSAPFILMMVVIAALASVVAIVDPLAQVKHLAGTERLTHLALSAATLINSWLLVPTIYTTHYADMYYSVSKDKRPLHFPHTEAPIFWDFAYFSFTIAAACQTSDVSTAPGAIRKVVIGHTIISFVFNASILGFGINVTAGLIGG